MSELARLLATASEEAGFAAGAALVGIALLWRRYDPLRPKDED